MNLLQAMLGTVLPVFILAGLGWVARRVVKVEVAEVARVGIYFMSPGMIVHSILNARLLPGEVGKIIAFTLLLTFGMIAITFAVGKILGWSQSERSVATLSSSFMNSANYGLPVVMLAFGQEGFDRAAVFVVAESIMMYTVAVYFAALGKQDWRSSILAVLKLPMVWAAAFALLIRLTGITLPDFVLKPIGMLSNGALVLLVMVLGMQVAGIRLQGAKVKIGVATFLRLAISPLLALGLVWWLRPEPLTAGVLVLEASMPAAVNVTLLAVQFDNHPDQVSGVTLLTTLLSLVTVAFWVWYLQTPIY